MKTLVTGGAGFIGSTLTDALLARGDDVVVVDNLSRGRRERVRPEARFEQLDIVSDDLRHLVGDVRPEVIFHHAAQIDVRRSIREPMFDTYSNVVGTVNLLQAAVDAGCRRVVFASSGGTVYGETDVLPTPESHPCRPESIYGAAKLAGETYGRTFEKLHGLEFVALRYANVYGPRQDPHGEAGVVAIFARHLLQGDRAVINGDGRQTRDYVYVDDVVAANLAAISSAVGAYNIGTAQETDVNQIYASIALACHVDAPASHGEAKPGEQQRSCLDFSLAAQKLGWKPEFSIQQGIERTVDFFRPTCTET